MTQAKSVSINQRDIGTDYPPYICAEISANHNGKLERALELISQASDAGADAEADLLADDAAADAGHASRGAAREIR